MHETLFTPGVVSLKPEVMIAYFEQRSTVL